ncbi:MAG TPA: hypothetical protein VD962_01485 [Rubricoccaceae bacterium]|nr:hypothetical protein [Rubricoccaceae bacterium]
MRTLSLALLLLALAGCGLTGGALVTGRVPTGAITVENQSGHDIDVVLLSRCRNSTYGTNRLRGDEMIPNGYRHSFTVDAGCWDVGVGVIGVGEARQRITVNAGENFVYTITG